MESWLNSFEEKSTVNTKDWTFPGGILLLLKLEKQTMLKNKTFLIPITMITLLFKHEKRFPTANILQWLIPVDSTNSINSSCLLSQMALFLVLLFHLAAFANLSPSICTIPLMVLGPGPLCWSCFYHGGAHIMLFLLCILKWVKLSSMQLSQ